MKRTLLFLFVTIFMAGIMAAQAPKPITWRMSVKMTDKTNGVVTIKATIEDGWHLYGTSLPSDNGPKPTSINLDSSTGVKWVSDLKPSVAPTEKNDAIFNTTLNWWSGEVTFTRKFKLVKAEGAKVNAAITFMGCNDATCLPPSTVNLSRVVRVPAAQ
ncbi:MAG: protein-disulfide reductase DsbD N-terminal domain-containing protein [Duncaniella sp.]|nr:protein-disulfide reductase DsbD N-terminal domain-containing protein [Duncaniella sp.]